MPKYDSDGEDDSCVLVGTPLSTLIPEDAKFTNKPKRPEEQIVTDEKGRQRFHGAFTGGFSAGYFNTVGTKEGFTPSTFKSSKIDRNNAANQRPEDFMDEEDFSEYGIAPKTLSIKSDFKDKSMTNAEKSASKRNNVLFFDDLIKPVRGTVGVRMLKKMGWREGQGIGPKIKRKLRKLKAKKVHEPGRKIYGVTLPTENEISDIEDEAIDDSDDYLVSLYDVNEFRFVIKEDTFGLGYKRLDVNEIFSGSNKIGSIMPDPTSSVADLLFPGLGNTKNKKKGIRGQAFGVGEFEDEDDEDLYKADTLANYDFDLDAKCENDKKEMLNKSYGFGAFENDLIVLKKFQTSSKKQEPFKVFKAPEVPKGFNLMHKFEKSLSSEIPTTIKQKENDSMNMYLKSATERGELLGETFIQPDSVMDLLSDKDKEFIAQQKLKQNLNLIAKEVNKKMSEEEKANEQKLKKEKRYEKFLSYIKKNYKDPYSFVDTSDLTEWEKEHEKDEFLKLYQSQTKKFDEYKLGIGSKFLSKNILIKTSNNQFVESEIKSENNKKESEIEIAAREKKFGKLTRIEYEWRPHNIICKRFNVPNPYPDSKEYGTIGNQSSKKAQRDDKISIFDVLYQKNKFESKNEQIDSTGSLSNKTPIIINKAILSNDEMKIEFETKSTGLEKQKVDEKIEDKNEKEKEFEEEKKSENLNKNNVYLQERPDIDIFKAIFDEDESNIKNEDELVKEEEEEEEEEKNDIIEIDNEEKSEKMLIEDNITSKEQKNSSIEIIPSSLSGIDYNKLNKYLKKEDFDKKNDFYDINEYKSKEVVEESFGPQVPATLVLFKPSNKKSQEIIKIDSEKSSDEYEFVEKAAGDDSSESSDESDNNNDKKNKKKKKKHHKKKSKKKSKKNKK